MLSFERIADKTSISRKNQIANIVRRYNPSDDHQRQYLSSILQSASKGKNTTYQVVNDADDRIGIFSLSLDKLNDQPCLEIDYLFVKPEFRSVDYNGLDVKASTILMAKVIEIANTIHEQVELKYVALQLAHDKLIPTYEELGFEALRVGRQKFWMGMPLQ